MKLPIDVSVHSLLAFSEFLHHNALSPSVIKNYISSIRKQTKHYGWHTHPFAHHLVSDHIRSITINSSFTPSHKDVFDLPTLAKISQACNHLCDPPLFRAAFLLAYFAFLRMSNIAPHSLWAFDPSRHLLRQDILFSHPGAHILLKWTKTMQNREDHKFIQIPELSNHTICPIKALLRSQKLRSNGPLFADRTYPHSPVIDTRFRDALREVLRITGIPSAGHGFHAFQHSGATLAFDNGAQLEHIMAHGL